jgi:hypothetical protein
MKLLPCHVSNSQLNEVVRTKICFEAPSPESGVTPTSSVDVNVAYQYRMRGEFKTRIEICLEVELVWALGWSDGTS